MKPKREFQFRLKPFQFSIAWLLCETALIAVACAGLNLSISGGHTPNEQIFGFNLFLIGSCGAIGGLFRHVLIGMGVGLVLSIIFTVAITNSGAFAA